MLSLIDKMRPYSNLKNLSIRMERLTNPTQEYWFAQWVSEALALGFILHYTPENEISPFLLFDGLTYNYLESKVLYEGTRREEIKQITKRDKLLAPTKYTPDGVIIWNPKVKDILFNDLFEKGDAYFKAQFTDGKWVTVLDVKAPTGTNRSSDIPFSFTRKWLWQRYNLYVNKVMIIPPKPNDKKYLYKDIWTPARYLMTDKLTKLRTIHYKIKSAEDFITEFKL